jgi:hypothetical protein
MKQALQKLFTKLEAVALIPSLVIFVSLLSTGCGKSNGSVSPEPNAQTEAVKRTQSQIALAPGLYSVFDDKSRSVKTARMSPIQEQDLKSLIDILRLTGGELTFGLIGESSDRPLQRLRIPVPPARPVKPEVQNAFERAEQDAAFQEQIETYEANYQHWEEAVNQRINAFLEAARPRLQEPARDKTTDVYSALARAELFLNEPSEVWPGQTHRYIILNSDGIDTARGKSVKIKSGARLLLVNGRNSTGVLDSLDPLRFESKQAALDFIAATELGRNQ